MASLVTIPTHWHVLKVAILTFTNCFVWGGGAHPLSQAWGG